MSKIQESKLELPIREVLASLELRSQQSGIFDGSWVTDSHGGYLDVISPINGKKFAKVSSASKDSYERVVRAATENFLSWRMLPAPRRGKIVRQIGVALRRHKHHLAKLVTLETGKILAEAEGEIQEAIDIADFAVGLSRQLYGKTMHSERPLHRMYEQWHPLGNVGVITAFNFPIAVWAWNAMIGAVCGNSLVWKPSELTPLSAVAVTKICHEVTREVGFSSLFTLLVGDGPTLGAKISNDRRFPLVSATGSTAMGRAVGAAVAHRMGRTLLELSGNNAVIVLEDADLDLALHAVLFGAVGTAGQRCTTTRRLILHKKIAKLFLKRLIDAYKQVRIGNPLKKSTLLGPLIHERSVKAFEEAVKKAAAQGGELLYGGTRFDRAPSSLYVEPTIIKAHPHMAIVHEETFAPILYVLEANDLHEAIALNNSVDQGLSSSIFTTDVRRLEEFLSHAGSDCGIANVNIGTSGAEIGGAFGGEKDTGGGREAGSDSWKAYMRRQTNTINWGHELPLAQGIVFQVD